ncbi:MAG: hypothetical protein H6835_10710 [Planctomycetes bacterium]|nr:hypothetical protein [Planctomycetota bacterium]
MLEEFLGRDVTAPIYAKGWVDLMIDVDRDTNGKQVNERLQKGRKGGLPWMVILDADGEELVTSNAELEGHEGANIGGPRADWEQAWFVEMLRRSKGAKVTEAELEVVAADLAEYSQPKPK